MKLTWLGAESWRIYLGGKIILVHRGATPDEIDAHEAASGADVIIDLDKPDLPAFDPGQAQATPQRLIDQTGDPGLRMSRFAAGIFLMASDEPPLFLTPGPIVEWGRYSDDSVVVLASGPLVHQATALFASARPRLVGLAAEEIPDEDFAAIAAGAGRSAVQLLEPGLALEA